MTEDRDFKQLVRQRAAKTGESYQAARRQVERGRPRFEAAVKAMFRTPAGLVFGCVVETGAVRPGMAVDVWLGGEVVHAGTVASLRHTWFDREVVSEGEFGLLVDPAYDGPLPDRVTG